MMSLRLQEFDSLRAAVTEAEATLEKLETLRDRYDDEINANDDERERLKNELAEARLALDLGEVDPHVVDDLEAQHDAAHAAVVAGCDTRDAAERRIIVAERAVKEAREALSRGLQHLCVDEYERLANDAKDAYAAFVLAQVSWLMFAAATGLPHDGHVHRMHGTVGQGGKVIGGLDAIGREYNFDYRTCGPYDGCVLGEMPLDEVRWMLARSEKK